ncbi:MAG: hypothetical protein JNK22_17765 [Rhodocyclaceae bacterium]|nr:hypothetical protein [Rhodocyclaceae bacterium]
MNSDTVRTAIIGGLFALLGALGGAAVTGWSQVELARQKFNSDLVLKALESSSAEQRLESLKLLTETSLIKDREIQEGVRAYAKTREANPSQIPQVAPTASFSAPVVANPRVYLLAGNKAKETLFPTYKSQLESAGYRVLGAKLLSDSGRPAGEEVRYFNAEDKTQAEKIAEVVRFKLSVGTLPARFYEDDSAKPGYIEIWFGK